MGERGTFSSSIFRTKKIYETKQGTLLSYYPGNTVVRDIPPPASRGGGGEGLYSVSKGHEGTSFSCLPSLLSVPSSPLLGTSRASPGTDNDFYLSGDILLLLRP